MDYHVEDIEDQMIATLVASADLAGVNVRTHAGQVSLQLFIDPKNYEGLLTQLPFIFVRYGGRTSVARDARGSINNHTLAFTLYVGAESLRTRQESQRDCYSMLRAVYDELHGHWPYSTNPNLDASLPVLTGTQITTSNFRPLSPLLEEEGLDEALVIELPRLAIYSTTYKIQLGT